ncbi:hypothetical protein C3463_01040 [Serratia marcescens]|uniref:type 1 fimbrial protein n=1 Tax=Serratia marcescens TaxID=615 RepID=UPI000CDD33AA|nr:type 1 fimbrial protein [Serratia marcescens]POX29628.1 hypothetical protein C3463_01040 [Serratia marcescens]
MKNSYFFNYIAQAFMAFFFTFPVQAMPSGTIHFSGTIVEPSCRVNHEINQVNIDCSARSDRPVNSDAVVSHAELEYLDNEKTLAIAHVTYR